MSNNENDKPSLFAYRDYYPEVKGIFAFRPLSPDEMKADCLIVLDTNVLLAPYSISPRTLEEIEAIYKRLADNQRLFIPGQVAREFAIRRTTVVRNLRQQIKARISKQKLSWIRPESHFILQELEEYTELLKLENEAEQKVKEISLTYKNAAQEKVDRLLQSIDRWHWNDPITALYREVIPEESVIEINASDDDLRDEYERRMKVGLPPGTTDLDKEKNGAGDFFIWKTILELGKDKGRNVLFVTQERKEDWWFSGDDSRKEPIFPRFELIDEFRRFTDSKAFSLINFPDFLSLFEANKDAVEEVERETEEAIKAVENIIRGESIFIPARLDKFKEWERSTKRREELYPYIEEWIKSKFKHLGFGVRIPDGTPFGWKFDIYTDASQKILVEHLAIAHFAMDTKDTDQILDDTEYLVNDWISKSIDTAIESEINRIVCLISVRNERVADLLRRQLLHLSLPSFRTNAISPLRKGELYITYLDRNEDQFVELFGTSL